MKNWGCADDTNFVAGLHANGVVKPAATSVTVTTSLLDSDENFSLGLGAGFPTSGYVQFYILLKRTFLSTFRDKVYNWTISVLFKHLNEELFYFVLLL